MKTLITLLACALTVVTFAQTTTLKGKVSSDDADNINSVTITIKGTSEGTITDRKGNFIIATKKSLPLVLVFSHVNIETYEQQVTSLDELNINLKARVGIEDPIVLAPGRVATRSVQSAITVEKLGARMIESTPSINPHDALKNLKGVDVITSSLTFTTPSTRGFNGSGSARVNQLMDGMDNQAPGLNFSVGNLVGATSLDVEGIELLPGASSALYGPGGMNGTILVSSKNPFKYQGLSIIVKQGMMNVDKSQRPDITSFSNWTLRWARALGNKFAFKVGAEYLKATDWLASDSSNYSRLGDVGNVIAGTRSTDPNYDGVNVYGDETTTDIKPHIPDMYRALFPQAKIAVSRTGYAESDIADPIAKNFKLSGALHYKINNKVEASMAAFWAKGNSVYTGSDRYVLKNVKIGQYKLELKSSNWFVRAYTTQEDAGDSYAATTITRYFNEAWKPSAAWYGAYVTQYLTSSLTGSNDAAAHAKARAVADQGRPLPGSAQFNQIMDKLKRIPISKGGGLFFDKTNLYMAEGQYNFGKAIPFADVIIGGNFKRYVLNSQGTIFIDTTGTIPINEVGGYVQATKKLLNDKLTLAASGRLDKNENFKGKFTPRLTALINVARDNNIRVSYQTAYRFPTTQQQFIQLQVGSNTWLLGGLPWILPVIQPKGSPAYVIENGAVTNKVYQHKEFKPETCSSFEIGYKALINQKFLLDVYGYTSKYKDFLGRIAVYQPLNQTIYAIVVNSENTVNTHGFGLGMDYLFSKNFTASANFYSDKIGNVPNGFIANFNTPEFRCNLGLSSTGFGKQKKWGFALQYKWQDAFKFENDFANGNVNAFSTVDAQVGYKIVKNAELRIGGTNLTNHYYKSGFGNPEVGGLYYTSLRINIK